MVKYVMFSMMLILSSCLKDDILTFQRRDNLSRKLKLHGYYLNKSFTHNPIFFYENGVVFKFSSRELNDSLKIEEGMDDLINIKRLKELKYSWGVYKIENQKIIIERWYPGEKPYDAFLETGEILNDSTFRITTFSEPDGSEPEIRNEIYKFRKFTPKPDSTNVFIK